MRRLRSVQYATLIWSSAVYSVQRLYSVEANEMISYEY